MTFEILFLGYLMKCCSAIHQKVLHIFTIRKLVFFYRFQFRQSWSIMNLSFYLNFYLFVLKVIIDQHSCPIFEASSSFSQVTLASLWNLFFLNLFWKMVYFVQWWKQSQFYSFFFSLLQLYSLVGLQSDVFHEALLSYSPVFLLRTITGLLALSYYQSNRWYLMCRNWKSITRLVLHYLGY